MSEKSMDNIVSFLKKVMHRRKCRSSQLAASIGISPAAVSRWVSGKDIPNTNSCLKLAEYSGEPITKVLALAGHLSCVNDNQSVDWPEFREYARKKYSGLLDDEIITMIEDLIESRIMRRYKGKRT